MLEDGIQKWKGLLFIFFSTLILTLLLLIPSNTVSYTAEPILVEDITVPIFYDVQKETEEVLVEVEEAMPVYEAETEHLLHAIAVCESSDRQFDGDGKPLMNSQGSSATGRYQIMSSVWRSKAEKMGFDIDTARGNKEMAHYILTVAQGLQAWEASAACLYSRFNISI